MLGFEPQIFGVGSDRSANWATTTAQKNQKMLYRLLRMVSPFQQALNKQEAP